MFIIDYEVISKENKCWIKDIITEVNGIQVVLQIEYFRMK